jgi:hypothetical protein
MKLVGTDAAHSNTLHARRPNAITVEFQIRSVSQFDLLLIVPSPTHVQGSNVQPQRIQGDETSSDIQKEINSFSLAVMVSFILKKKENLIWKCTQQRSLYQSL